MLGALVRKGLDRLAQRLHARQRLTTEVRGIKVLVENPYPNIENAFVLGRLDAALLLIEQRQPIRFRHLQRDVSLIWVTRHPTRGCYFPDQRTVMTEVTFLNRAADFSAAQVASSILHEGVHARVHRMGLRFGFGHAWRQADEERLCRRAEVTFGHSLPPDLAAPVLARAEAILAVETTDDEAAPVVDWTQAHLNKFTDDVQRLGLPPWLARPLLAYGRWRIRPG